MTSYFKFNSWVFDYYINNCIPYQLNTLSIPSSEIENFTIENDIEISRFNELNKFSWLELLKVKNEIPQYFGLVALQCLAAYKMQNLDGLTAANFKARFAEIIGITNYNDLNSFFSEDFDNKYKIQEKIWYTAKEFFERNNIKIDIPHITAYAGRFIQFPKSQIILTHEDLKEYEDFFKSINEVFESISFEDFKKYYVNNISKFRNSFRRNNNTKSDNEWSEIEKKIKIKQIFDYYCTEDWEGLCQKVKTKEKASIVNYTIKLIDDQFFLFDEYHNRIEDFNSLIRKNRFMMFRKNKDYPNEYESVNSFSVNDNNIFIVYNSPANSNEIRILKKNFQYDSYESEKNNFLVFKIIYSEQLPDFLINKFVSSHPIELIGFKVSGGKKYFVSHPPKINCLKDISYHIFFKNRKIQKNEINKVGKYTIKINGYSNYNFELLESPVLDYSSNTNENSLVFKSLNYLKDELGSISGLQIKYDNKSNVESLTINNWIQSLVGKKIYTESQLLKSISQSKNGKY